MLKVSITTPMNKLRNKSVMMNMMAIVYNDPVKNLLFKTGTSSTAFESIVFHSTLVQPSRLAIEVIVQKLSPNVSKFMSGRIHSPPRFKQSHFVVIRFDVCCMLRLR